MNSSLKLLIAETEVPVTSQTCPWSCTLVLYTVQYDHGVNVLNQNVHLCAARPDSTYSVPYSHRKTTPARWAYSSRGHQLKVTYSYITFV